jgi:sugar phosphate isomerase/epimerase
MQMEPSLPSRRSLLAAGAVTGALAGTAVAGESALPRPFQSKRSPWPLCLDTATIRPASLEQKISIAAATGFDAIEPWDGELREFEASGGSLADLGARIRDLGLFVPSMIGLWDAIPEGDEAWTAQLPATRDRLRMAAAIGAEHVQVIPGPPRESFDLRAGAARYRELLEIGLGEYGVNPAMVFVKFLPGSRTLGQAAQLALDADHPKAKVIPDVFHMYIGGSGFEGLRHLAGEFIAIFQINDAPASPPRDQLEDEHRVFPGDGILPLEHTLRDLAQIGYRGCVSLELYNPEYWKRDPASVAQEGREKTLAVIERALA